MVLTNRLFIQVLFLLSILVIVAEVWGATSRRQESINKPLKKRIRSSETRTTNKETSTSSKTESNEYEFCRNYNRIKKNVQDSALSEDFIVGKRSALTELLDVRDRPYGNYNKKGFSFTFDSYDKVEYGRAVEACLYRKLQLLAKDKIDDSYFYTRPLEFEPREYLWTSAAPCSKSDPLNKTTNSCSSVTWCPNNVETRLDYTLNLGKFTPPYCLIYRNSTNQLELLDCSIKAFFTCESACSRAVISSQNNCQKDESLFEVIGRKAYLKKEHEIRGTWEKTQFGFFYYLGEKFVNWRENWMTCCSLGLKPIALTDSLLDHFNRSNILQGVAFWSALTRAGCPLHFENFLHNASESLNNVTIFGIRQGGSCVAVSIKETGDKEVKSATAVKTNVCASKLLLGCQGTEQTFDIRDYSSNCDLPVCTGLPDCVMKDEIFLKQPFRVLLAPWRFGNLHSCCDNSILELHEEYGTWDEAYKRCCSLGMDLLSVHNPAKQDCLGNPYKNSNPNEKGYLPFRTKAWTAGRDIDSCRGQLRWCTGYLNDYLKKDLKWKQGHDPRFANNSCVYINLGDPDFPSLALADCSEKKQIICEAPMGVGFKSQMHYHPCRRNYKVKESEAEKIWNTGDFSRTSYAAKNMIQCLAEHIGLVYNSTEINQHVYIKMLSRMLHPLDVELMKKVNEHQMFKVQENKVTLPSSFEANYGKRKIKIFEGDMLEDGADEFSLAHFDFVTEMMNKLYECREIKKSNEDTFMFDFLVCLLQSKAVDRFWRFYDFNFEQSSVIPADHDLNSPCMTFDYFLKNDTISCIPPNDLLLLTESGPFITLKPINLKMFNTSSFTACLERNGSLPYAETKEVFEMIYNYIRSVAPKLTIIWDQGFFDKLNGKFMWCRSDIDPLQPGATIPIPVTVNATTKQDFVMLVSLPGAKPNLHAVPATDELMYQTNVFCRFQDFVVNKCLTNV
ncbi:Hypothetical predicted protein [Cloeon dipterum]|uniref:C-type lectin domain-containing protein n=1 Tax=Cloeon dipterum TaxID=197152 RepID=A0A8S1DTM2_9INSE|nr:Hypothetical predicted protein [Cloeon dipterum]